MHDDHDPVRQQLTEARRAQIISAAVGVFAAKGFTRATTRDIAEAAGVSEGTIYNYFGSKADLLAVLVSRLAQLQELQDTTTEALQEDAQVFFERVFAARLKLIADNQALFQAVVSEVLVNKAVRERFYARFQQEGIVPLERYLRLRIERGELRRTSPELTMRTLQSMFLGLLMLRVLGDAAVIDHWDELPAVISDLLFHGIGSDGTPPLSQASGSEDR